MSSAAERAARARLGWYAERARQLAADPLADEAAYRRAFQTAMALTTDAHGHLIIPTELFA